MKALNYCLICLLVIALAGCGFTAVDKQTPLTGTVQLQTGEPVPNYPLSVLAKQGSLYGSSSIVDRHGFHTDQTGAFSYQGEFKSGGLGGGLGYQLQWALYFSMQGQNYSVDTVEASIPDAGINITPGYRFNGNLFAGKQHTIKIILRKD